MLQGTKYDWHIVIINVLNDFLHQIKQIYTVHTF